MHWAGGVGVYRSMHWEGEVGCVSQHALSGGSAWECLPRRVSRQGGLSDQGGVCLGGGCLPRSLCPGVSAQGGLPQRMLGYQPPL